MFVYAGTQYFGDRTDHAMVEYSRRQLLAGNFLPSFALINRDSFLQAGGFCESVLSYEDYDLWLRLAGLSIKGRQRGIGHADGSVRGVHGRVDRQGAISGASCCASRCLDFVSTPRRVPTSFVATSPLTRSDQSAIEGKAKSRATTRQD